MIDLTQQKTQSPVIIPLTPLAKEIVDHFGRSIPPFLDSEMNRIIKLVAELAGFKDEVISRSFVGGVLKETRVRRCDLIGTHTMRRSFATNMFKMALRMKVGKDLIPMIMRVTGHKSIRDFLLYICIDEAEAAKILQEFMATDRSGG